MEIAIHPWTSSTRPCRFCFSLQGDSVFADFDVDPDGRAFAVRVSYDGFGCCDAPANIGRMSVRDSEALLAMVARAAVDASAEPILRAYFRDNRDLLWSDALERHGLL